MLTNRQNSRSADLLAPVLSLGLLLAGLATFVMAAANPGQQFQVNTFTAGSQLWPAVAMNASGASVIAWTSFGQDGDSFGIFAQRYAANGVPVGSEFQVNTTTSGEQRQPAAAMDAAGNFVIVWSQPGDTSDSIFARLYEGSNGQPIGPEFQVNAVSAGARFRSRPAVAMDTDGDFVVVWEGTSANEPSGGIFARLFSPGGLANPEFVVNTTTADEQSDPAVAMNADGDFVVAWTSQGQDAPFSQGVFAQRFSVSGSPLGGEFAANTITQASQFEPAVAIDSSGNVLIAWVSTHIRGIFARGFEADGTPIGDEEFPVSSLAGSPRRPSLGMDAAGNFVASWDTIDNDDIVSIQARLFDSSLTPQGIEFQVNDPEHDPIRNSLGMDAQGNFVVAWEDQRGADGQGGGIFGRRYTSSEASVTLSINHAGVLEGDSRTTDAVFTVALSRAGADPVTVEFATADGSASRNDNDYVARSGTLTFSPGETTREISIPINGDTLSEPDETFLVNLSNASNATIVSAQGGGTIFNDDNRLSINDVVVQRPRTGTSVAVFTVSLSGSHDFPVTVNFATANGSALAGDDYVAHSGTLTFAPAENTREIRITVNGHALAEPDDAFFVILSGSANAIVDKAEGVGSIHDPDYPPIVPGSQFAFVEYSTGTQFQVSLISHAMGTNPSGQFVIAYVVPLGGNADGTAIFAQRFAADATPQGAAFRVDDPASSFHPQQAQPSLAVAGDGSFVIVWTDGTYDGTTLDNGVIRGQRYGPDGVPLGSNFLVSRVDVFPIDDATPSVAISGAAGAPGEFVVAWRGFGEGGSDIFARRFDSAGAPMGENFLVNSVAAGVQLDPAVAASPYDFVIAWHGSGPGDSAGVFARRFVENGVPLGDQFPVNTYTDNVQELPTIGMDAAGNFVVAWEGEGAGGDRGVFARCFSSGAACHSEFAVRASRNQAARRPAVGVGASGDSVIAWDEFGDTAQAIFARLYDASGTAQGTAIQASDTGGFASFRPETSVDAGGNLVVSWLADAPFSAGRVRIMVRRFTAAARPPAPLSLAIGNASVTRPLAGTVEATFNVNLSAASAQTVTVDFESADGTAIAGVDYRAASGMLTFAPGETAKQIVVHVLHGASNPGDATFFVNLRNPAKATILRAQGTGVIREREAMEYTISVSPPSVTLTPSSVSTLDVTLQSQNGVGESVQLTTTWIGTAPTGVSLQLSPAQVSVPSGRIVSSSLTVATSSAPSIETFTLRITGQSASGVTEFVELAVLVQVNRPTATCACTETGPFVDPRVKGLKRTSPFATVTIVGSDLVVKRNSDQEPIASDLLSNVSDWGFSPNGQSFVLITKQDSLSGPTSHLTLYSVAEARIVSGVQGVTNPLSWGFSPDAANKFFLVTTRIPNSPVNHVIMSIYDTDTGQKVMEETAIYLSGVGEPPEWADEDGEGNDGVDDNDSIDSNNDQVGGWGFSPDGHTFLLSYKNARVLDQDKYFLGLWNLRNRNFTVSGETRGDVAAFWQFSPCGDLLMLVSQQGANPANTDLVDFFLTSDGRLYREINVDTSQGDPSESPSAAVVTKADGSREIQLTRMSLTSIPAPDCSLSVTVHSPVNILLIDEQGRRTGFDPATGGVLSEIPGGRYTGPGSEPQTITVPYVMGAYTADAYGLTTLTSPQPYALTIESADGSQDTVDRRDFSALASRGSLQRYTFVLGDDALLGSVQVIEVGDTAPPQIQCASPNGQWHGSDVSLVCTAIDSGSGLADPADASFTLSTNVEAGTETANAATDSRTICDVAGNCAAAGPIEGNMIDKKAPAIAIDAPARPYVIGEIATLNHSCQDGGSGVASCAPLAGGGFLDTAAVGTKVFTVRAEDRVRNATVRSVEYEVAYGVALLYNPQHVKKAGSAYPIKVRLTDAAGINRSSPDVVLHAAGLTRAGGEVSGPLDDAGNANPDFAFRYDAALEGYIFNLKTRGLLPGQYNLTFRAGDDPTLHSVPFAVR